MSELIDRQALIKQLKDENIPFNADINEIINIQPIAFDVANIVEKLEEKTEFLKDCTKCGNKDAKQQEKSYSTMMMYEVADLVDDLIYIVKQEINNGLE